MASTFKVNEEQLVEFLGGPSGPVWRQMMQIGNRIQNRAVELAPVDRGKLRSSIKVEMRREKKSPVVVVGTNVFYAIYVHNGTGVHGPKGVPIRPVNKKFLAWRIRNTSGTKARYVKRKGKTAYAFAKEVQGVRGRPFLTNALKQVLGL